MQSACAIAMLWFCFQSRAEAQATIGRTDTGKEKVWKSAPDPDPTLFGNSPAPLTNGTTFKKRKLIINGTGPSEDPVTRGDPHSGLESNTKIYDREKKELYHYPNDMPGVTATREMRKAGARPGDMAKVCASSGGSTTCDVAPIYDTYNGSNDHAEITPGMARNLGIALTPTERGYNPPDMRVDVTVYPGTNAGWGFYPNPSTFIYMTDPQRQIDYYRTLAIPGN